ncbi:MAG TPA: exopolysaccharide biosynthesis protein [Devosia sp.]|nr:exopolysaccharide biosynthesis protein [Devosia sp.]
MTDDALDHENDPIIPIVDVIVAQLRERAERPNAALNAADLLTIVGERSHVLAIMLFALLNLLPGPPGYNFLMAVAMFAVGISMLMGRPMNFGNWFGRMPLPLKVIKKLLEALAVIVRWIARISTPRWRALTGPGAMPFVALIAIVLAIVNMAPVPFMNLIPSAGLAVICMGVLNQDGVAVLAGIAIGALGTLLALVAIWLIFILAYTLGDMVEHAIEGDGP